MMSEKQSVKKFALELARGAAAVMQGGKFGSADLTGWPAEPKPLARSDARPPAFHFGAATLAFTAFQRRLVGTEGFEPPTFSV